MIPGALLARARLEAARYRLVAVCRPEQLTAAFDEVKRRADALGWPEEVALESVYQDVASGRLT